MGEYSFSPEQERALICADKFYFHKDVTKKATVEAKAKRNPPAISLSPYVSVRVAA